MKKLRYDGTSKVILRIVERINYLLDNGGGGHTIIDNGGQAMTTRAGLQIKGASVYDDSTNDKTVVQIPTKLSDFTNDAGFITSTVNNLTNYYKKSETYTQAEVDALISAIVTLNILVVQTLPTQDISTTTIYLVPKATALTDDVYDEYLYINNAWECIGSTTVDLSNYYTKSQTDTLLNAKVSDNPTFTEASTRANIASGESFATILGKIKKFFTDLKAVAFSGSYNDLDDKPTIPSAQVNSDWNASSGVAQILNKPSIAYTADARTESIGAVIVTHPATSSSGRFQMFAYGNGNGTPWMMEIMYGATYVNGVVLCGNADKSIGVRYIDTTHFAVIAGMWDTVTVYASNVSDWSVAKASVSYTIDTDATFYPVASNATYATTAGSATDNTKVAKTGDVMSGELAIDQRNGTSSAVGYTYIKLGNNLNAETAENSAGVLRLYGQNTKYVELYDVNGNLTSNRYIGFPNKNGTIALITDIPTDFVSASHGGTFENSVTVNGDFKATTVTSKFNIFLGDDTDYINLINYGLSGGHNQFFQNKDGYIALTKDFYAISNYSGQNTTKTITFSGSTYRRQVVAFLIAGGQSGIGGIISILFSGSSGYGTIDDVRISDNSLGITTSGKSIIIPNLFGGWGLHTIIRLYQEDELSWTIS